MRINPAGQRQPHQFQVRVDRHAGLRVWMGKHHRADLYRPDPAAQVELDHQGLARELRLRDVREQLAGIHINRVAARRLDDLGVHYIEGGWPGSNPKDMQFFQQAAGSRFHTAKVAAFGATRKPGISPSRDANLNALIDAGTKVTTIFGKSWDLHAKHILCTTLEENLEMIREMSEVDGALKRGQEAAARVESRQALAALDRALDTVEHIRDQRNVVYHNAVDTWYESWFPRVGEANGRKYLDAVDDVKDHLPMRTVDMSYLVYRELILPLGEWHQQVQAVRNQYARAHGLPARAAGFDWKDLETVVEGDPASE